MALHEPAGVIVLDGKTRQYLRGRAHGLKPAVLIGREGVTDAVVAEIERTAEALELIKLKILQGSPLEPRTAAEELAPRLRGEIVGRVGRTLIYFLPGHQPSRYPLPPPDARGD